MLFVQQLAILVRRKLFKCHFFFTLVETEFFFFRVSWNITDSFTKLRSSIKTFTLTNFSSIEHYSGLINDSLPLTQFDDKNQVITILKIENAMGADIGNVKCIAENIVGRAIDTSLVTIMCKFRPFNDF